MLEIGLTDAKTTFKRPSGAPKTRQIRPHNAPKAIFGSKKRANEAQDNSKTNLEALFGRSRGPKELPRESQELPKGARESPTTLPKPSLDRKRCFFKNVKILIVKSTFWRVGWSVWELKIDPKRLREESKNDIVRSASHIRQQEAIKRGPRQFQGESGSLLWSIQRPERAPKRLPRAPQRSPREPPNAFETIFGSKTLIFQKC